MASRARWDGLGHGAAGPGDGRGDEVHEATANNKHLAVSNE